MRKDITMKKTLVTLLFAALLSMTACSTSQKDPYASDGQPVSDYNPGNEDTIGGEDVQIPNPWTEYQNADEMAQAVGFEFRAPDTADGLPVDYYQAMDGLAEIDYSDGVRSITLRKGTGTDDKSGDCNSYAEEGTLTVGDHTLTVKGSDGIINLAVWNDGEYTYSISSADRLSEDAVTAIAEAMI